jgi:serpin B
MLTRRDLVHRLALAGLGTGAGVFAGCGQPPPPGGPAVVGLGGLAKSDARRAAADPAAAAAASGAVRAFGGDLYRQLSRSAGNLVCSPYSVAVALAMTRNGARGGTAAEMDRVLHAPRGQQLNGGLGAIEALLERRSGPVRRVDGSTATVALRVANSLWGQRDLAWQTAFLDALARHFGAGMRLVDFSADSESARSAINAWTGEQTAGKIDKLLPPGVLGELTRLVLVNAVYLKAPWEQPFEPHTTRILPFRRVDGSTVDVPTMTNAISGARYARGRGWQAAEVRYAGRELAMTVVLPDAGTREALDGVLDGDGLTRIIRSLAPVEELDLRLPKWKFRTAIPLKAALSDLGMPTAFTDRADFSGMTVQERLFISAVLHEAFIAVDESGTEAAAATAVVMRVTSAGPTPIPMVVDRPFVFVIHDLATATPIFIGRVTDPVT